MSVFRSNDNVYFGKGITREAMGAIFDYGKHQRPLMLYDSKIDLGELLSIDYSGMIALDCSKEPTYADLARIIKQLQPMWLRRKWDLVIGVGGGSALDIAKAVAVLLTNEGPPTYFKGFDKVTVPGIPVLAIPTTLSGSEATNNASFIDTETKTKMGINGRHMFVEYSILDSKWLPAEDSKPFVSTFLDAITHAYEASICVQGNAMTRYMAERSLAYLFSDDLTQKQVAAHNAAQALCNSGSGIAGAISYPLGVHYGVPHGIAGGIFLPDVMRFNKSDKNVFEAVELYLNHNGVSLMLSDYGVGSVDELHELIKPLQGAFDQNPNKFDADKDGRALLEKHWGGAVVSTPAPAGDKPVVRRKK